MARLLVDSKLGLLLGLCVVFAIFSLFSNFFFLNRDNSDAIIETILDCATADIPWKEEKKKACDLLLRAQRAQTATQVKEEQTPLNCYENLDVATAVPPFKFNQSDVLGNLKRCGKTPILQSKRSVDMPIDDLQIPKIVHFVYFAVFIPNRVVMPFKMYLSILSVHKFIKPRYIFWHGNVPPEGPLWEDLIEKVPNIYWVKWVYPRRIYNWPVSYVAFASDFTRIKILAVHGGIYLDEDVYVLKSFDPLRNHSFVMTRELRNTLINCVILSKPYATFLRLWFEVYRHMDTNAWSKYNMQSPSRLQRIYPHLIHVEENTMAYPTWPHVRKLYNDTFDWSQSYSIHIQGERKYKNMLPNSKEAMDQSNTTIGDIMRYIYYT